MTNVSVGDEVRALAGNLASSWNGGRDVLRRVVEAAGDSERNPWRAAHRLGDHRLSEIFAASQAGRELSDAFERLTRYLTAETWYERASKGDRRLAELHAGPVAYFCAEFGLAAWLPLYSGGLGILAGDVLKESSDMGLPFVGVGLFYEHGFFYQRLDEEGYQREEYPSLSPADFPLSAAVDETGREILVEVPMGDRSVFARVWQLHVGRTPLYLLDTDVPQNERPDDREITGNLYGGNQETRIRQELVLGVGGVRALRALGLDPRIYSMNEGHAAFLGVELLAERPAGQDVDAAMTDIRSRVVYTNHTVVPAGNDVFSQDLVRQYLAPHAEAHGIDTDYLLSLGASPRNDGFSMAELAFHLSGKANAVSELHAQIIPREWPGYAVEAVTNGVHVPSWAGTGMEALFDRFVPGWRGDAPDWGRVQDIPAEELWRVRNSQRRSLVEMVNARQSQAQLDPDALTLVWARRFAEYKRAWLITSDLARLDRLMSDSDRPVQLVISGKSHPADEGGKRILQDLLRRVREDSAISGRVAFVEDYNEDIAHYLVGGADIWLNTPRKPLEASGTSGMKAGDNGGLQLTVCDGWAAEVNWYGVGWGIDGRDDALDAQDLYAFLEHSIVPTFFNRDSGGVPGEWITMMKRSMIVTLSRYSARRMMLDYIHKLYLPLLEQQASAVAVT